MGTLVSSRYILRVFPGEDMVVHVAGTKVTGSARPLLLRTWGEGEAREHYHDAKLIHRDDFDSVYWDGMEKLMASVPEMFAIWATKQTSGCCATNHHLRHIDGVTEDRCPNCKCSPERADHISRCLDPGCARLFETSVQSLREWLARQRTSPALNNLICHYLRGRGRKTLRTIAPSGPRFSSLVKHHDRLGWRNFLEG